LQEEQEETTAKEEGEEIDALESALSVGGFWRGHHVLGTLVDFVE